MTLGGTKICVAIPDSVLEERSSLREKTVKLGQMARACSIFGVDRISIFPVQGQRGEGGLIKKILEYLETPQYLRKHLFSLDESLRFAGLLPPLRIPSHKPRVPVEKLQPGEFREGFVLPNGRVDIGLDRELRLRGAAQKGTRVTVRIASNSPLEGALSEREQANEYWGYSVEFADLTRVLADPDYPLRVATSRYGTDLADSIETLRGKKSKGIALIFGSPSHGLFDIVGRDLPKKVDLVVNLFTEQHVNTVRTEESLTAALYLLDVLSALKGR